MKRSDISDAEMLEACKRYHNGEAETPDIALASKYPVKVIMAKMDHMNRRGLLDYGFTLRTAWSTDYDNRGYKSDKNK